MSDRLHVTIRTSQPVADRQADRILEYVAYQLALQTVTPVAVTHHQDSVHLSATVTERGE